MSSTRIRHVDLIVLGGFSLYFLSGFRYGLTVDGSPGPGMAPVLFAGVLAGLVIVEFFARLHAGQGEVALPGAEKPAGFGRAGAWLICIGTLATLILFGAVLGTFLSLFVLASVAVADWRWGSQLKGLCFATLASAAIYAVFGVVFRLPMIPPLLSLP